MSTVKHLGSGSTSLFLRTKDIRKVLFPFKRIPRSRILQFCVQKFFFLQIFNSELPLALCTWSIRCLQVLLTRKRLATAHKRSAGSLTGVTPLTIILARRYSGMSSQGGFCGSHLDASGQNLAKNSTDLGEIKSTRVFPSVISGSGGFPLLRSSGVGRFGWLDGGWEDCEAIVPAMVGSWKLAGIKVRIRDAILLLTSSSTSSENKAAATCPGSRAQLWRFICKRTESDTRNARGDSLCS